MRWPRTRYMLMSWLTFACFSSRACSRLTVGSVSATDVVDFWFTRYREGWIRTLENLVDERIVDHEVKRLGLSLPTGGIVADIPVEEGDTVAAGVGPGSVDVGAVSCWRDGRFRQAACHRPAAAQPSRVTKARRDNPHRSSCTPLSLPTALHLLVHHTCR